MCMKWKSRSGVVCVEICGIYLLIADKNARRFCPYTMEINETGVFIWKMLEAGATIAEIEAAALNEYLDENTQGFRQVISDYIKQLDAKGYVELVS